jgi:adenosylmethionine-8-amino-7-oxononanoate aminotransferase
VILLNLAFDKENIWHPYTSLTEPLPVYPVKSAEACEIILEDGTRLIDGIASWWCAIHGYNHPELNEALLKQTKSMSHVMFGGLTHEPAINLAKKLVEITPKGLNKVFFSDSGSVSVEVAIKMAIQYWHAQGSPEKKQLITIRGGYHGDTIGAMSVCDPISGMHSLFKGVVQEQIFAERPKCKFEKDWEDKLIHDLEVKIERHHHELAALILEPVAQCAGGMWFYSPMYLKRAKELCDQYDLLLIADEVATGFGRTGKMFACEWAGIVPDIMCVGKGLTGGYMGLAATITTDKVAEGVSTLMHGPTFMANALACAVANKSIELLVSMDWQEKVLNIENILRVGLSSLASNKAVLDVRVLGAIGVVEMKEAVDVVLFQKKCVELGVWLRPFGKLIYIMPPYVITEQQLLKLISVISTLVNSDIFNKSNISFV